MTRGLAVWILSGLVLSGCGTQPSKPDRLGLKLPPAALGSAVSLQQNLSFEWQGHHGAFDAVLEVDAERLELVGLALGQRVLSLRYDGNTLKSWRHPMWPAHLCDEDVIEDLQLTLWPVESIREALPAGWRIEESGLRRVLLAGDLPMILIEYSGAPRWLGRIELSNLRYRYRLTIRSVSNDP
jgi:hypothetical protein